MAALAQKLGEPVDDLSPLERAELALGWFARGEGSWLLVLDNVESPAQLDALLPRAGGGRVLVTSRDRAVRRFAPALALDVFDEPTAVDYLTQQAGRPADRAGAERLAGALGYLPLALAHAGAYCESGTSFNEYLTLLGALPAADLFDTNPEASYTHTVASTWKVSIQAATAQATLAASVLALAAPLAPGAIPRSLFAVLIDSQRPLEQKRLRDAFNALAKLSLATVDDTTVSVHRLLQKVVRDDARARHDDTAVNHALRALEDAFPTDPEEPARWPQCEQLLAHVLALAQPREPPTNTAAQHIGLLNRACDYLHAAKAGSRAVGLADSTFQKANRILGPEHPDTLRALNNLATAYQAAGRLEEAIAIYEPLLADRERILGAEHPDTLNTRGNLASAYWDAGRVEEAIAIYEPLLADHKRILGPEHPDTLGTRHNLGSAYWAAGRVAEAIAIYEPLLADRERILGAEHADTLTSRQNLAGAYWAAGRVAEAIAIYEPLLADSERILGPEHPHTLTTRHNLASAYQAAGRVDEAG